MPNHIKFCGCHACKAGKHTPTSKAITRSKVRAARHACKIALTGGREPVRTISAGRTD